MLLYEPGINPSCIKAARLSREVQVSTISPFLKRCIPMIVISIRLFVGGKGPNAPLCVPVPFDLQATNSPSPEIQTQFPPGSLEKFADLIKAIDTLYPCHLSLANPVALPDNDGHSSCEIDQWNPEMSPLLRSSSIWFKIALFSSTCLFKLILDSIYGSF